MPIPAGPLSPEVLEALQRGNTVEAIKLLRESSGLGLKEAKDIIDQRLSGHAPAEARPGQFPAPVTEALRRGNKIEAIRLLREHTGMGLKEAKDAVDAFQQQSSATPVGLSPGEVPASRTGIWWLVAVAIAGVAAYYFFRVPG